ncbi:Imm49 family immunity protein [Vibrio nigripulchritudo]|uniref:Imm49 family immunity protein n=1 Tax=Vibrio nigripulchritudo TaxID=28173 RepID=UPI00138DD938|nr:Imm49 family immunity protein [Vibrio nigripulchritudo]
MEYTSRPEESSYFERQHLISWLDGVCINAILRNNQAVEDICKVEGYHLNLIENDAWKEIESAYQAALKLYFSSDSEDKIKQQAVKAAVEPYLAEGAIDGENVWEFGSFEDEVHGLYSPLYRLVKAIWSNNHQAVEEAAKEVSQANYNCYAYTYPERNGDQNGEKSLDLGKPHAMFHYHLMGILSVYFDRTGKRMSYSNAYAPDWLIYGEGPTREEVLANPPIFDLEHVLGNQ